MDKNTHSSSQMAVDLRALVWASAAVTPVAAWLLIVSIDDSIEAGIPWGAGAFGHALMVIGLITQVAGSNVVALGAALYVHRRSSTLRPLAFMTTALAFALPFVVTDAIAFYLAWLHAALRYEEMSPAGTQYEVAVVVLRLSCLLVSVALASRLYLHWRRVPSDRRDVAAFLAFSTLAAVVSVVATVLWVDLVWSSNVNPSASVPLAVLWTSQFFLWTLASWAGAVFLFGSLALAAVRRAGLDGRFVWVLVAGLAAGLAYWLIKYLAPMAFSLEFMDSAQYRALATALLTGVVGGLAYLQMLDGGLVNAIAAALTDLPGTVRTLRRWPHRPSEEEER